MKVLFAVQDEQISSKIVKEYQKKYKEIISYKNIYYFTAILKELQKDKTYDRIVIDEELEELNGANVSQKDKFIFDKLDNISDEAYNASGEDIPIILICSEGRNKSEDIFVKLFGIGIYNAIIGNDRSTEEVCRLIERPRSKKQAKVYYKIDADEVQYKPESENDVSEEELQNILIHFKKIGKDEAKYVESFSRIVKQYNSEQIKVVISILPLNVKAVLEEQSPEYQNIVSTNSKMKVKPKVRMEKQGTTEKLLEMDNPKTKLTRPVVIPATMQKGNVKKLETVKPVEEPDYEDIMFEEDEDDYDDIEEQEEGTLVEEETQIPEETLQEKPRRRGRPRKNPEQVNIVKDDKPKKRGRPKKIVDVQDDINLENDYRKPLTESKKAMPEFEEDDGIQMPGLDDEDESTQMPGFNDENDSTEMPRFDNEETSTMPGFDDEYDESTEKVGFNEFDDEQDDDITEMSNFEEDEDESPQMPGFDDDEDDDTQMPGLDDYDEEDNDDLTELPGFDEEETEDDINSLPPNIRNLRKQNIKADTTRPPMNNQNIQQNTQPINKIVQPEKAINNYDNYSDTDFENLLSADKKIVAFVGTSKNGTSFMVNNVAQYLSQNGINTAIIDTTQNKNSFYIYTKNEENLRQTASASIPNLINGMANGIKVNANLSVYTTVPNQEVGIENVKPILETLIKNHSAILIDSDFNTPYEYFAKAQEIYLVQSMDILTIQPLTAFLRELKSKNILDQNKIRILLNKIVRLRSVSAKNIIGGMAYYNDPEMSFMTELFNRETVKYLEIPFDEEVYAIYLDGIVECEVTINKYPKNFQPILKELANMVYPLLPNKKMERPKKGYDYSSSGFSSSVSNTLNDMKRKY